MKVNVFQLEEDGLVHIDGEVYELDAMTIRGVEIEIESITTVENDWSFVYKARRYPCCQDKLKNTTPLLVGAAHYITPCYRCEVWVKWVRKRLRAEEELE